MANPDPRKITRKWLTKTTRALLDLRSDIDETIDRAAQQDINGLLIERGRVHGLLSTVRRAEEEFEASRMTFNPPTQQIIDQTVEKAGDLGKLVLSAKKAAAIVALVTDLTVFVTGIIS